MYRCCLLTCVLLLSVLSCARLACAWDSHPVSALAVSADGRWLLSGSATLRLWALPERRQLRGQPNPDKHAGQKPVAEQHFGTRVGALAFRADGEQVAVGLQDGSVELWDARLEERVGSWPTRLGAITSLAWTPDGLLTAGDKGRAVLWNAGERARLWQADGTRAAVCVTRGLVATGDDRQVHTMDLRGGKVLDFAAVSNTRSLSFSDDGRILAASTDRGARVWDVTADGHMKLRCAVDEQNASVVALSPGGRDFLMGGRFFSVDDGLVGLSLQGWYGAMNAAVFVPGQRLVVTAAASRGDERGSFANHLQVWDTVSGALWWEL